MPGYERGTAISADEPPPASPASAQRVPPRPTRWPARARCGAPWRGPGTASRSTRPRPPSCSRRAAMTWPPCCAHAGRVRDSGLPAAGRPGIITYSRKVFIPLTRLCRDRCAYCTFVTVPGRLSAPFLSPDEVLAIAAPRAPRSAARKRSSPSVTVPKPGGSRPASGWTRTATTTRCPMCGRWRSGCWRRPACCRT